METSTPNNDKNNKIRKIKSLLSKTIENGASQQEMESALAKANQMMLENFIEEHELVEKDTEKKCVFKEVDYIKTHYEVECGVLFHSLSQLFDCKCHFNNYRKKVTFFGYEEDVEMCEYFYNVIVRSALKCKDYYQKYDFDYHHLKSQGYHGKTLCASYIKGFIFGVCGKMRQMYKERKRNIHEKYGLVVLKEEKVNEQYSLEFTNIKKAKPKKLTIEESVFDQGFNKGESFDLHQGLNGSDNTKEMLQ